MDLVVATTSKHKLQEIRKILPLSFNLVKLDDLGFNEDIPETGSSFTENALIKARTIYDKFKLNCLADDSGLEVEALNGQPGIYSSRYAGPNPSSEQNILKLLSELAHFKNKKARFKTALALIFEGKEYIFEGTVSGNIKSEPSGTNGFGYDPVFIPEGYTQTFGEMEPGIKDMISHRADALRKMNLFFKEKNIL
jgi:XTP/dITP diphosphohydrolase